MAAYHPRRRKCIDCGKSFLKTAPLKVRCYKCQQEHRKMTNHEAHVRRFDIQDELPIFTDSQCFHRKLRGKCKQLVRTQAPLPSKCQDRTGMTERMIAELMRIPAVSSTPQYDVTGEFEATGLDLCAVTRGSSEGVAR